MGITSFHWKLTYSKTLKLTTIMKGNSPLEEEIFFPFTVLEYLNFRSPLKLKTQKCIKVHGSSKKKKEKKK